MENQKQISEQSHIEFGLDVLKLESLIRTSQPEMSQSFNECRKEHSIKIANAIATTVREFSMQFVVKNNPQGIKLILQNLEVLVRYIENFLNDYQNNPTSEYKCSGFLSFITQLPQRHNFIHDVSSDYIKKHSSTWNHDYQITNHELANLAVEFYLKIKEMVEKLEQASPYLAELSLKANKLAIKFYQKNPNAHKNKGLEKLVKEFFYEEWGFKDKTDTILTSHVPIYENNTLKDSLFQNSVIPLYKDKAISYIMKERQKAHAVFGGAGVTAGLANLWVIKQNEPVLTAGFVAITMLVLLPTYNYLYLQNNIYLSYRKSFVLRVAMLHLLLSPNKDMNQHKAYQLIQSIKPPAKPQA